MIWQSMPLMTVIDVVIIGAVLVALWIFVQARQHLRARKALFGFSAIVIGLALIGVFFAVDLFVMWSLPWFVSGTRATAFIEELRLNYAWVVMGIAVSGITLGFALTSRHLLSAIGALTESELRFKAFAAAASEGVLIHEDGVVREANEAAARIMRLDPASMVGGNALRFVSDDARTEIMRRVRSGVETPYESTLFRDDGSSFLAEFTARSVRYQGRQARVLIFRDISGRVEVERQLRESEEKFAKAFRSSPAAIVISRLSDGRFTEVNESFCRITGYGRDEVIGRTGPELDVWRSPAEREQFIECLRKEGRVHGVPVQFLTKGGKTIDAELSAELIELSGEPHMLVVGVDVTERNATADALRESESRFRSLSQAAFEGIAITEEGHILEANQRLAEMLRCEVHELVGRSALDFVAPESREEVLERIEARYDQPYEHLAQRKDGSVFPVEVRGAPMQYQQRAVRVVAIRDITLRKQADDALRRSREQLEVLSKRLIDAQEIERSRLSRELHDEVGQALTAVKLNLQMMDRLTKSRIVKERVADSITIVDSAVDEVRNMALDLRPSVLDDLGLEPALRWYTKRQAERSGVAVHFSAGLSADRPSPEVETACFRVAQEAITNAMRHARAQRLTIELRQRDNEIELSVQDDGVGFDTASVREQPTEEQHLGLISMRERAALLGGHFHIESTPGQGTLVRVHFPMRFSDAARDTAAHDQ